METNALSLVDSFYLPYTIVPYSAFLASLATVVTSTNTLNTINVQPHFENVITAYHYSIPTTKLAYPEPFVASASLMHSDL